MNATERSRSLYHRRREQGLCTRCGKPARLKANGEPSKLCVHCWKVWNDNRSEKRKENAEYARVVKEACVTLDDLKVSIDRLNVSPTLDAIVCDCGGIYYSDFAYCPWCGKKVVHDGKQAL